MAQQDALLHLIRSLNPVQVAQARRALRGRKLDLFNVMLQRQKYLQEHLGKTFGNLSESNFAVIRAALLAELTLQFSQQDERESAREQIREQILKAGVLQTAGKFRRAITTLDKAVSIACRAEEWQEASRVLGMIQLLMDDPEDPVLLDRRIEVERVVTAMQNIRMALIQCKQAKGGEPNRFAELLQEMEAVLQRAGEPSAAKAALFFHHASAFVALFRGQHIVAKDQLVSAHRSILRLPEMLRDPLVMDSAMSVELSLSVVTLQLGSAIEALQGLQEFLSHVPAANDRARSALLLWVRWLELVNAFEGQDKRLWVELNEAFEEAPGDGGYMAAPRAAIYISIASMAIENEMARVAIRWFERAFDLRKHIETARAFEELGVVYLAAMAMLGDWEGMDSHVPRVRNLLARRGMPEGILREFGLACLGIAHNPEQRLERWSEFLRLLEAAPEAKARKYEYLHLNLRNWVTKQLNP